MASIPLPALSIKQPESPLTNLSELLHAKAQQQGLQTGQLQQQALQQENQQREVALKDQQAQTEALKSWDGKNLQDLPGLLLKHGGSATAVFGLKQKIVEQQTALTKLDTDTLANQAKKNDFLLGSLQSATSGPDEGLPDRINAAAADAVQKGYLDPQHAQSIQQMTAQTADPKALRQQLTVLEKSFMGQKEQFDQEARSREVAATEQRNALEAQRFAAQGPGGSMQPVEQKELSDWLAKNPGKGPSDFMAAKAKLVPQFNFNLQNQGTTGAVADVAKRFGMTPVAFDQAAEKFWTSGQLPPAGRGGPALAMNKAIMNRAGDLHPEGGSLAANSAEYKANTASLDSIQKNFDNVTAFENTAGKNLDNFLTQANKLGANDAGAKFFNVPLRMISRNLVGTADMAAFDAARTTALTEISKVLNSSNANGVLSDSARHEVEGLIGKDATFASIKSAATILKQDMANRHQSYQEQINAIKGRLSGKANPQGSEQNSAPLTITLPSGKKITVQ